MDRHIKGDPQVDSSPACRKSMRPPWCLRFFGDIRLAHDLYAAGEGWDNMRGIVLVMNQNAVLAEPDPEPVRGGLHMDVADAQ